MSKLKKLPVGIQTFKTVREEKYLYIDKTKMALDLVDGNQRIFLSRPRRFGKSMFLDTLKNIFEGNKELFKGLYIYDKYDFKKYPVIKISWGGDFTTVESTLERVNKVFKINQENLGIKCGILDSPSSCFEKLIREAYKKYGEKVVVLVDEYDKPILDAVNKPEVAESNRELLRSIYVMLKENDEFIKFAFLTGISKFSKASIFSGLNNLEDISLNPQFGNICGYTQNDIETNFLPYLEGVDLAKLKEWYNGYNFLGDKVYNPFDILLFIKNKYSYENYWFSTATPNFLVEVLKKNNYFIPKLENLVVGKELIDTFDIENIALETLLFQTGYLTIDKVEEDLFEGLEYHLRVPNKEIQMSLNNLFINYLTEDSDNFEKRKNIMRSFLDGNLKELEKNLKNIFSSIPYNNYTKNKIYKYEGYYASVIYTYLASLGVKIVAEDVTNLGRIDLTVFIEDKIYILEFKVKEICDKSIDNSALNQIKEKRCYEKYLEEDKEIYLLGIEFSKEKKNICGFQWEKN